MGCDSAFSHPALVRNSIHFSAEVSGRDEEWSMKKIVDYMSEAARMNGSCARPLSEQPWGHRRSKVKTCNSHTDSITILK